MTNNTQASQQVPSVLLELPEPARTIRVKGDGLTGSEFVYDGFFSADQMREYARSAVLEAAMPGQVEASDPEAKGNISAWLRRRAGNDMVMIPGRLAGQIAEHIDALKSASVSEQKGDV